MFVQVIQGQVADPDEFRQAVERWVAEVSPGATGWLGSTGGVTADGQLVAVVRFESEDAARRNSDRPEQDEWWAQTAKLFTGEPTFRDSTDIDVDTVGDPDQAGFVQLIQGRTSDPARARAMMSEDEDAWATFRPDILGSLLVAHEDGEYTMVLYFTSEADARDGERKEAPPELQQQMADMGKLEVGEPTFLDLTSPWLNSPR